MSEKHYLGKYRLLAELGHGGMADVFLAMVEGPAGFGFAKLAVVKRLRANLVEDPDFMTMLMDEARITARLSHPNVVQMLEVGSVDDEEYFLAMEYLDGQPLHRIERRAAKAGKKISRTVQITILIDVLSGLQHAHEFVDYDGTRLDIIHRDVTPQNIFVTYDGQVKVMDFGIAKAAGRAQETKHGIVKGKARFMSPEQAAGGVIDRRSDIFAVGLLLWQAATGKRFWGDKDDMHIFADLISGRFDASPRVVDDTVPEELDRICRRALAHQPNDRYETALDMQQDLEAFIGSASLKARRELTGLVGEHFGKERAQLRSIVEAAGRDTQSTPSLARISSLSSTSGISSVSMIPKSMPPNSTATDVRVITVTAPPTSTVSSIPPAVPRTVSHPPPTTRSMVVSVGVAAVVALAVVARVAAL